MNDANVTAHAEMKALIERVYLAAYKAMTDKAEELVGKLVKDWENCGGCKTCNGMKRVLHWWTLDGASWDEFAACKDCTPESNAVGPNPMCHSPQGSQSSGMYTIVDVAKNMFYAQMADLFAAVGDAEANKRRCIDNNLDRAEYVIVLKGRKVAIGTHGVIIGFSQNNWGSKVGFIDGNGTCHWTAITNVERCLGMDGETARPAIEAFIKSEQDYAKKKGYKPKTERTVEAMMLKMM